MHGNRSNFNEKSIIKKYEFELNVKICLFTNKQTIADGNLPMDINRYISKQPENTKYVTAENLATKGHQNFG